MNSLPPAPVSTSNPSPQDALREQFVRPGDVMSVLLILGGDVIQRALAQLSGGPVTPVAFSFGWVTYAISALLAAVGDNKLIPLPDSPGLVINSRSRYSRQNNSWIVGRIIRDYEFWRDARIRQAEAAFLSKAEQGRNLQLANDAAAAAAEKNVTVPPSASDARPIRIALSVAVYDASPHKQAGVPDHDWLYYSGVLCAVVQLGVAAIPWGLWGDWSIMMTTAIGITFAFASGSLPQWKAEKYKCRKGTKKTVTLTRGNGNNDCIVIIGGGFGMDMEDLAAGQGVDMPHTRIYTSIMAVLWIALLIAVSGLKENPWFLLVVGVIGMIQNVIVCGAPRRPGAFGVHIEYRKAFVGGKVMEVLQQLEEEYPRLGRSLVDTYFPGGLRPHEEVYWKEAEQKAELAEKAEKAEKAQ